MKLGLVPNVTLPPLTTYGWGKAEQQSTTMLVIRIVSCTVTRFGLTFLIHCHAYVV